MVDFTLERLAHDDKSSHSQFLAPDALTPLCQAVERAKEGSHPRIPTGRYKLIRRAVGDSRFDRAPYNYVGLYPWYKGIIEVSGVPGRSAIEIHIANAADELEGCVAPNTSVTHTEDRGWLGQSSKTAWSVLYRYNLYPAIEAGAYLVVRDLD